MKIVIEEIRFTHYPESDPTMNIGYSVHVNEMDLSTWHPGIWPRRDKTYFLEYNPTMESILSKFVQEITGDSNGEEHSLVFLQWGMVKASKKFFNAIMKGTS